MYAINNQTKYYVLYTEQAIFHNFSQSELNFAWIKIYLVPN